MICMITAIAMLPKVRSQSLMAAALTAPDPVYAPILARLKNEALLAEAGGMVIATRYTETA
ncbi:MAG: hypothetical protein ACRCS3_13730, partial [Paracoccaceae bacterium]